MTKPGSTVSRASALNAPAADHAHPCVRCGIPIPLDVAMCERCNPLGLADPSSSQVHGTVLVGIILAVIVLAVAGRAALQGVGPFNGAVASVSTAGDGLSVTLRVRNDGTSRGTTTCRIREANGATTRVAFVSMPNLDPGESATITTRIDTFGAQPRMLSVDCPAP